MKNISPIRFAVHVALATATLFPAFCFGAASAKAGFDIDSLAQYQGYLVTDIAITGFKVTREYVIRREIQTRVGEPFDLDTARLDLIHLDNLGIFASNVIHAEAEDSTVALTYKFREMPWLVPYPKIAYTEQDGFSLGFGVGSVNLFGYAIYLSGFAQWGGVDAYSAVFRYPWITGNHISIDAVLANRQRDDALNEFREHSKEFTPWIGRWLGKRGRIAGTVSVFQMIADRDDITLASDRHDQFLRFGLKLGYDSRTSWRNAHRGWNNELLFMWSFGSPFDKPGEWPLLELDLRRYQPVHGKKNTLVLGSLTSIQDGNVGTDIPGYLQYRMGGANSIRGYDVEVLGKELFGRNQWIVTVEFQRELIPLQEFPILRWAISAGLDIAAFVDYGVAWSRPGAFTEDGKVGGGVGLRFLLPGVYELRTDLAVGDTGKWYFHLGVGIKLSAQRQRLR